jgi:hypothetical protein
MQWCWQVKRSENALLARFQESGRICGCRTHSTLTKETNKSMSVLCALPLSDATENRIKIHIYNRSWQIHYNGIHMSKPLLGKISIQIVVIFCSLWLLLLKKTRKSSPDIFVHAHFTKKIMCIRTIAGKIMLKSLKTVQL